MPTARTLGSRQHWPRGRRAIRFVEAVAVPSSRPGPRLMRDGSGRRGRVRFPRDPEALGFAGLLRGGMGGMAMHEPYGTAADIPSTADMLQEIEGGKLLTRFIAREQRAKLVEWNNRSVSTSRCTCTSRPRPRCSAGTWSRPPAAGRQQALRVPGHRRIRRTPRPHVAACGRRPGRDRPDDTGRRQRPDQRSRLSRLDRCALRVS